jgi:hypothetical protein
MWLAKQGQWLLSGGRRPPLSSLRQSFTNENEVRQWLPPLAWKSLFEGLAGGSQSLV